MRNLRSWLDWLGRLPAPIWAVGCAAVILGYSTVQWFVPYLRAERAVVSVTPSPNALFGITNVGLGGHQVACLHDVTIASDSEVAQFTVATLGRAAGPRLRLVATGPGYQTKTIVPGGYGDHAVINAPLQPPRQSLHGQFCVRNLGRHTIGLYGTAEPRTQSRPTVTVNGKETATDVGLQFYRRQPRALINRLGSVFSHITAFTWSALGPWLLWILAPFVAVGLPLGILWALVSAIKVDARRAESRMDPRTNPRKSV